jgi:hypothetical protein
MMYKNKFYSSYQDGSINSAKQIIPIILQFLDIKSVVDIGCGIGTWLSVCKDLGINDILGVDGDYVNRDQLLIPQNQFLAFDIKKRINIDKRYDLAISLEVGEHLPKKNAEVYIKSLVGLSDVILFSAAIPFQGGVNHINCQWPEYWINLFNIEKYNVIDLIRKKVWNNPSVDHWYSQNAFLFVKNDYLETNSKLLQEHKLTNMSQLSIVHPKRYLEMMNLSIKDRIINKFKNYLRKLSQK